jgi:hypothetical protein
VAQSEDSFVASSQAQFYVSCSRGKQTIRIYTDSRSGLQQAVGNPASRMSAVELAQFTRRELGEMSKALNEEKWREALERRRNPSWRDSVKSRLGPDETKTYLQSLIEERRGRSVKQGESISWEQDVAMKRGMAGPDGKNRSKGHPAPEKKKGRVNGALIKRSEHTTPVQQWQKAVHEAKKAGKPVPPPPANDNLRKPVKSERFRRAKTAAQTSAKNLKSVLARHPGKARQSPEAGKTAEKPAGKRPDQRKQTEQPEVRTRKPVAKPSPERAAEHRIRQKRQQTPKPEAPAKKITPVVRKGR